MRTRRPFAVGTWRDIASSITASRWSLVRTCSSQSTSEFPHPTRLPAGQQCEPADELTEDQVEESERHGQGRLSAPTGSRSSHLAVGCVTPPDPYDLVRDWG